MYCYITNYPIAENNKYLLSNNFCESEIWECHKPVVLVWGLLWDRNQDIGPGYGHLKVWAGLVDSLKDDPLSSKHRVMAVGRGPWLLTGCFLPRFLATRSLWSICCFRWWMKGHIMWRQIYKEYTQIEFTILIKNSSEANLIKRLLCCTITDHFCLKL